MTKEKEKRVKSLGRRKIAISARKQEIKRSIFISDRPAQGWKGRTQI